MSDPGVQILTLVEGCCKNDRNNQRELYHLLFGYAMKICYRYTSHQHEAEELTNESFVKLFKNIKLFDASRQTNVDALFKAWFKRIVINTCIDHLRRNHSMLNGHSLTNDSENIADAGETGIDRLSYEEIVEAIRQLSPVYKTVFNLFVIEGMTHEEIASQLDISVGASKSNLSKARNNLRKIILHQTQYKAYVSP
ncbi:MAG TPA: sigma-70 family RNA polymerase sigma factor [Chitinophagaceae bacterium]